MPTPAEFSATVSTAVLSVLTAQSITGERAAEDLDTLHLPVPTGEARVQVASFCLPQTTLADSGANYRPGVLVVLLVHFKLLDPTDERAYTEGAMQAILQTLATPQWWRDLSGVHFLDKAPVGTGVARIGNVVSFTVTASVTIDPP